MPLRDAAGSVVGLVASAVDLTERQVVEAQLARRALHDPLTDLPNRILVMDRLAHALAQAERRGGGVAVLFLDLDRFKLINDGLGHDAGDRMLVAVAQRLTASLRAGDTVGRFAGDEFVVVLEGVDAEDAKTIAERLLAVLGEPVVVDGHEVFTSASIGVAFAGDVPIHAGDLLRNADTAMYRAKATGKAAAVVFDPSMHVHALRQLDLEAGLRRAVERNELRLYYQPIVDLTSGRIVAVEALVRWDHPRHGLLLPEEIVPLAEETGIAPAIGEWILREACRQLGAWETKGFATRLVGVNVNTSARQIYRGQLVDQVNAALRESGLPPQRLWLEVTEHAALKDIDAVADAFAQLRSLGVRLALDDFGTGSSSLNSLQRLPFNALKIARSFVAGFARDRGSLAVARAVTALAHDLGMGVTAEGIETDAQRAYAWAIGCNLGQGHRFTPPLPPDLMADLLAAEAPYPLPPPPGVDFHAEATGDRVASVGPNLPIDHLIARAESMLTHAAAVAVEATGTWSGRDRDLVGNQPLAQVSG
jgi:diguanylate cyclase (GGDEF)-like protein